MYLIICILCLVLHMENNIINLPIKKVGTNLELIQKEVDKDDGFLVCSRIGFTYVLYIHRHSKYMKNYKLDIDHLKGIYFENEFYDLYDIFYNWNKQKESETGWLEYNAYDNEDSIIILITCDEIVGGDKTICVFSKRK